MKQLLWTLVLIGLCCCLLACTKPREDFIKVTCPECNVESYHEVLGE